MRKRMTLLLLAIAAFVVANRRLEVVRGDLTSPKAVELALEGTALLGDGLYGVDLKEVDHQVYVIEVNDNPNIDAGNEDAELGQEVYERVMAVFRARIEARRTARERSR